MIDIKFSKDFDQELENLFKNLEEDKKAQKISQNFISPYCYDLKSIASNNESYSVNPFPVNQNIEPQATPRSKSLYKN